MLEAWSIRPEVVEAAGWIHHYAGDEEGAAATVLTDDYIDRLWLVDGLRDLDDVTYPYLTPDYFGRTGFSDGVATRFVLVSRAILTNATPQAVVAENDRYVLLDTAGASAWFILALEGFGAPEPMDAGRVRIWMGDTGSLLVMRTARATPVRLAVEPNALLLPDVVRVSGPGDSAVGDLDLVQPSAELELPLPGEDIATVRLSSAKPAVSPSAADPRLLAVSIVAPTAAGL